MGRLLKGLVLAALLATSAQPVLAQSAPSYLSNPAKAATWGSITGTLSSQTDLNTALAAKVDAATAPSVICQGAAQQTVTGTATETQVLSCSVPGGTLLANGRLALVFEGTFTGANANRVINFYFGGTLLLTITDGSTVTAYSEVMSIANRNSTGSQRWKDVEVKGTNAVLPNAGTSSIDTTASQTVVVKIQLNASDSATLDSWQLLAYPKS